MVNVSGGSVPTTRYTMGSALRFVGCSDPYSMCCACRAVCSVHVYVSSGKLHIDVADDVLTKQSTGIAIIGVRL